MFNNGNFKDHAETIDIGRERIKKAINDFKKKTLNVLGLIFLIIILFNSFYILNEGNESVIFRFDKAVRVEKTSGIKFKIPIIEKVKTVNVQEQNVIEYGFRTKKAGNEFSSASYERNKEEEEVIVEAVGDNSSLILIDVVAKYKVENPINFLTKVDDLEGTIRIAFEETVREIIPSYTVDEVLKIKKEEIGRKIRNNLQEKLEKYEAGVYLVSTKIQNAYLLEKVNAAREEIEKANQYKKSKEEESQKYENSVIPRANAEANKILEEAKGYKAETIADARAETAEYNAIYDEYIKNPSVTKEKYYIQTMKKFIENNNIIIDGTENGSIHKFFNIDENAIKKEIIN